MNVFFSHSCDGKEMFEIRHRSKLAMHNQSLLANTCNNACKSNLERDEDIGRNMKRHSARHATIDSTQTTWSTPLSIYSGTHSAVRTPRLMFHQKLTKSVNCWGFVFCLLISNAHDMALDCVNISRNFTKKSGVLFLNSYLRTTYGTKQVLLSECLCLSVRAKSEKLLNRN